VGIQDRLDGRGLALVDLDNDGDLDAVVANQSDRALIYRNDVAGSPAWIAFDLEGTVSNRGAVGARVTVFSEMGAQTQVKTAATGFASQNDPRLIFGLDGVARPDSTVVEWPSGIRQSIDGPAGETLHLIQEPDSTADGG
jgi:hypothetical protein